MNTPDEQHHIMVDLETLGTEPGSVIVTLAAVQFGGQPGRILNTFIRHIRPDSCEAAGLRCNAATALWWLKQSEDARRRLEEGQKEAIPLDQALKEFGWWLPGERKQRCIWGNGASFDCALLAAAYRAVSRELPWSYAGERCYRTIKALHPDVPMERQGTHHDALDDAKSQALHLMQMLPHSSF